MEPSPHLTRREIQILERVALGERDKEIAEFLGISPWTVKGHMRHILRELDTDRRAFAVTEARARGLLSA